MFNTKCIVHSNQPFDYWVIDNFLSVECARKLSKEFIDYNNSSDLVHYHDTYKYEKKTCNSWNRFPPLTYQTFANLLSTEFVDVLSNITGCTLYPDIGLHGGGWHMHRAGGKLALHLDYSKHPKLPLQRKLNLIIYLEEDYDPIWGGSLELWSHDSKNKAPLKKVKTIEPLFNRAVLFDTTQNSWHGFPEEITCPEGKMRKSIAVYYLTDISSTATDRYKAVYAKTPI